MSKPTASPPPNLIAQFELVRRLGAGGMAEVFLAKKPGAEGTYKLLVLKRILPTHGSSRRFRAMFIEEARLATRLNHPNVVQVYEFQDFGDEGLLLAMEYVEGCDLGHLARAAKESGVGIPPWVGAWIIAEAGKGLHYAHEKKDEAGQPLDIVHRDVSPQNILLSFEGAVKIADFGIASARLFAEEQGVLKGKFGYMSPEQARGETVDRRSDVYALGVVFWELLAARPIHGGLGGEALLDIVRSGIVENPKVHAADIPDELEGIVMRALSASRDDRFPTVREMVAAIGKAIVRHGELIDASALEVTLGALVGREAPDAVANERPVLPGRADDARTQAAVPLARSLADGSSELDSRAPASEDASSAPSSRRSPNSERRREVRHVAVLSLRLHGFVAHAMPRRMLDRLRGMLDDLAFKRGMRWIWSSAAAEFDGAQAPMSAIAVAGLAANAAHAASDAAQLALDVHETISGFKEDLPTPVSATIGIARGIASGVLTPQGHLAQYALSDPAAPLAEMLSASAPLGKTWVAGGIYRLVRRDFRWGEVPALKVDDARMPDMPAVIRVSSLERSLSREERLDAHVGAPELVGRDAEKIELRVAYRQSLSGNAVAGPPACRAIVGEMGIGKTALVATFLAELPPNVRLIHIDCTPISQEVPHAAIAEMVRQAVGTTGEEPFEQVVELIAEAGVGDGAGDAGSPLVARLAELVTNRRAEGRLAEDAHVRKKQIVAGVRHLLSAVARVEPLVLVVEGIHWADKASLEVISDLVHGSSLGAVLVLVVARPDERIASAIEGIVRCELSGLTSDEQVRLVETRLGVREGAREICADLLPKVGGNPFFLLEMIDALLERGVLAIRERVVEGEDRSATLFRTSHEGSVWTLPSTLEQLLGDRIRELPLRERTVVNWLAIAGGPLSVVELVKLGSPEDEEAVVRLCARGVCDRKGELADFRHPIAREVAYASIDADDRTRMHRALGEHLASTSVARGLSAAIVAKHLARGQSYDRAATYYFEAGAAARTSYQTRLAIRYYLRATSCLGPEDRRRMQAHEALESAYRMLGRRRERLRHLRALRRMARKVGTPRAVCLGLLRSARYEFDEGLLARGVGFAQQAARVARTAKLPVFEMEAEARVSEFLRELGEVQGALAACDRALEAFDPAQGERVPPRQRGEVLRLRGTLLLRVGRVREAVSAYVDAIAIFRKCGGRRLEARAKGALAYAMFVQGRYEDGIALALESIQIDVSIGVRFQIARALTQVGHSYFCLGDAPRALAYLQRAREVHERYGDQNGWAETLLVSAAVATELGTLDAAETFMRDAGALTAVTGNAYDRTHEGVVRALLARARYQPDAAVHHAVEARRSAERMALVAFHFYAMAIEAVARIDLGEVHAAALLATTALGAVENLQGCEYGLETRLLCADALNRAASPRAHEARQRAADYARDLSASIRNERLRRSFLQRPIHRLRPPEGIAAEVTGSSDVGVPQESHKSA